MPIARLTNLALTLTLAACAALTLVGCPTTSVAPVLSPPATPRPASATPATTRPSVRFDFFIAERAPAGMTQAPAGKRLFVTPHHPDERILAGEKPDFAATDADLAQFTHREDGGPGGVYMGKLKPEAAGRFKQLTAAHVGHVLVILVNDQVAEAPVIRSAVPGDFILFVDELPPSVADALKTLAASRGGR